MSHPTYSGMEGDDPRNNMFVQERSNTDEVDWWYEVESAYCGRLDLRIMRSCISTSQKYEGTILTLSVVLVPVVATAGDSFY